MKKTISVISFMLAFLLLFGVAGPLAAYAAEKPYEIKELTAYLFDMDHTAGYDCLFSNILPDMPYMDAAEYLNNIYAVDFVESENSEGTFTVSSAGGTMTIDPVNDTVRFDTYESFVFQNPNSSGSALDSTIARGVGVAIEGEEKSLELDMGAYQIDLIADDGRIYLPLATLADLFIPTYNAAEYVDGNIYFLHTVDNIEKDGYFDRSSVYETLDRPASLAAFTYHELCFFMDHFYGKPSKAQIAASIADKGFDKTLDEFSDDTRKAKELLLSDQLVDFMIGLVYLDKLFDDGGHTSLFYEMFSIEFDDTNPVTQAVKQSRYYAKVSERTMEMMFGGDRVNVAQVRKEAYAAYESVKSWDEKAKLIIDGDTAVFVFDSFQEEIAPMFKWSLDYAEEHGIKNFVVDLTNNGGGTDTVLLYLYNIICNKEQHTNVAALRYLSVPSGNIVLEQSQLDLNLDGEYDDKDKEVYYDFNYAVLTTKSAFSCGNLLPCMLQDQSVAILGETSGGGACMLSKAYTENAHFYFISGVKKFIRADGSDSDLGAKVDYDLTKPDGDKKDYSGLFDLKDVGEKIHDFYGDWKPGDANLDGNVDITDVSTIQRYDVNMISLSDTAMKLADVDRDGAVTILDATWLQRRELKMKAPDGIGAYPTV